LLRRAEGSLPGARAWVSPSGAVARYGDSHRTSALWTLDDPSSPGADGAAADALTAKRTVTSGREACRSECKAVDVKPAIRERPLQGKGKLQDRGSA
jgi:hypothetical protein